MHDPVNGAPPEAILRCDGRAAVRRWAAYGSGATGLAIVGGISLGGSIELVHNPVDVVEHARSKGASAILMPVSCRCQLVDLSDDVATKVQVLFYSDAANALRKVLHEG